MTRALEVTVRWGDYVPAEIEEPDGRPLSVWQRRPREASLPVALTGAADPRVYDVPDSGGLQLHLLERTIATEELAGRIPDGARSVSIFLVNRRPPDQENPDRAYAFHAEIEVRGDRAFVPRLDPRGAFAEDWDEQVADLHYADAPEYATGHGVSADWDLADGACRSLRTAWIPRAEVENTATVDVPGVESIRPRRPTASRAAG